MLDLLAGFVQELRAAGLPVSLTENLDAMEAVQYIPIADREAFKYALAATLVKNNSHWRAFETVFEVYFSLRGPEDRIAEGDADALDEMLRELQEQQQGEGDRAAPRGSRRLPVGPNPPGSPLKTWATIDPAGTRRIVVINKDLKDTWDVVLRVPGPIGHARAERLAARSSRSTRGVSFGGQTY